MAIKITTPTDNQEFSLGEKVNFQGTADGSITQIELFADDRWLLGKTQVSNGTWSMLYPFNAGGTRLIVAKGFDTANNLVASDDIWLRLETSSAVNLDLKLSADFTLGALVRSTTADRRGIDNTPTSREVENLRVLCQQILQPARDALGALSIQSGFRSETLNQAVGGVPNSDHRKGFAADVVPVSVGIRKLAEWVNQNCEFDQIILEFGTLQNPKWIHLSAEPRNRKQVLRATSDINGNTVYTTITL